MAAKDVPCDEAEAARYLGYAKNAPPDDAVAELVHGTCADLQKILAPQAVYDTYPLAHGPDGTLLFAGTKLRSVDLSRNLERCSKVVLFAATVGPQVDLLIRRTQLQDKACAAVLQGAGAMFIESFVDSLNDKIRMDKEASGGRTRPRYSPGYGDVPLSVQRLFFSLLPCGRIGLSLMDTLIMAPEKSVTAFIGIQQAGVSDEILSGAYVQDPCWKTGENTVYSTEIL
jgi:Methionine synthase I, cobalamin-binding domain